MAESDGQDLLSAVTRRGEVVVEGHSVGHVSGFSFLPDPLAEGEERKLVLRAARRALRVEMAARVGRLEAAEDTAFTLDEAHRLHWDGAPIARLLRGATKLRPRVDVLTSEFLDGAARERVRVRLQRFVDAAVRQELAPLFTATGFAAQSGDIRGPVHRLSEALGVVPGATDEAIPAALRGRLKPLGVRAGRFALFLPTLLKPRPMLMRARLWTIWEGVRLPALPAGGLVSIPADTSWPAGLAEALGWLDAGPVRLRLDVAERVAGELSWATRHGASALPAGLAGRFAVKAELLPAVLRRLGVRLAPASVLTPEEYGPPAPAMILPPRRRRPAPEQENTPRARVVAGPFAALAALKR
jgi:ATP-dependent RNA helicase SUPV3L1/SUV3